MTDKVIQGETKLQVGDEAPDFALPAQDGKKIRLSDYHRDQIGDSVSVKSI